jgi:two-component system chemotaxis response regulator CheB
MLVTQHMPPMFTKLLADHIARLTGVPISEAVEGEAVENGHVYLAPGNFHMTVAAEGKKKVIRLNQDPPENFCRPAVDVMLRSVVKAYDRPALTVILTGMGADGLKGGEAVVESGGVVIAQDRDTSVVWGMPGAVATAGLCTAVLPLEEVAPAVMRIASGEAL